MSVIALDGGRDVFTPFGKLVLAATVAAAASLAALPTIAGATDRDPWRMWTGELHRQCPSHHVDWVFDGGYDDLLYSFDRTLPRSVRRRVSAIAEVPQRCAKETMGFACEMSANLEAYEKLGLIERFAAFGCRHYRCQDVASCDRIGLPPE